MKKIILIAFTIFFLLISYSFCSDISVQIFPASQVKGTGPLPYNLRIINGKIYAGGHPLNPFDFKNTDKQVMAILNYLKSKGVKTIIDLENTKSIQERYSKLLEKVGIKRLHIPMSSEKTPTKLQWKQIKQAIESHPVYIHCKWGADRTGAVIAKFLIDEDHLPTVEAWEDVITGGKFAGPLGGLKINRSYKDLILFICPNARDYPAFKKYFE